MTNPACLLLDEPLSSLDMGRKRRLRNWLAHTLTDDPRPTILVTHDLVDVMTLADYVYVLEDGKIVDTGTPQELAQASQSDFTREFFETVAR